jgi:hypothetical protein
MLWRAARGSSTRYCRNRIDCATSGEFYCSQWCSRCRAKSKTLSVLHPAAAATGDLNSRSIHPVVVYRSSNHVQWSPDLDTTDDEVRHGALRQRPLIGDDWWFFHIGADGHYVTLRTCEYDFHIGVPYDYRILKGAWNNSEPPYLWLPRSARSAGSR